MKIETAFAIGDTVTVDGGDVHAIILAIEIHPNRVVRYETSWWHSGDAKYATFDEFRLTGKDKQAGPVEEDRGTGRTSRQMLKAPHGAYFIWAGEQDYVKALARFLNRSDLNLCDPVWLTVQRGARGPVVVDHAVVLTEDQKRALKLISPYRS